MHNTYYNTKYVVILNNNLLNSIRNIVCKQIYIINIYTIVGVFPVLDKKILKLLLYIFQSLILSQKMRLCV